MPRFNNRFIDAETYAFFKKIRMPYTGFVKGKGYAYTHANTVFPAHQCAVTPPTMVPYNQAHCQTVLFQYMNTSPDADRKSTRLNSSHVRISYAVFCLKKKKKKNITNSHPNQKNSTRRSISSPHQQQCQHLDSATHSTPHHTLATREAGVRQHSTDIAS